MAQHVSAIAADRSKNVITDAAPTSAAASRFCLIEYLTGRWRVKLLLILAATLAGVQLDFWNTGSIHRHSLAIHFLISFIYSVIIGLPLFYSLSLFGAYIARRAFPLDWVLLFVTILIPSVIGTMLSEWVLITLNLHPPDKFSQLTLHSLQLTLLLSLIFGVSFYFYDYLKGELEATMLQLRNKQFEEERVRKLAIAAQLSSLESRLRPHFLFNTLNSISALIRKNPEHAERMVGQLSALLRFSLTTHQRATTLLRDEIKLINDYLEIEQARFNERLRFSIAVPDEFHAVAIPPFTLQILVENSVRYAVAPRRTGGEIRVSAHAEGSAVKLAVCDDGPGFAPEMITEGHGLDNLQACLAALFADQGALEIQADGQSTTVTVRVPRHWPSEPQR